MSTAESTWLKGEREAAGYARMCLATWKRFRSRYPVKRVKLPSGSTLYRPEWIDACLLQFAEDPVTLVEGIVEDVMKEFS